MEAPHTDSIFELSLNEEIKTHLFETAKWSKLLAIVGFIIGAFVIFAGIAIVLIGSSTFSEVLGSSGGVIGAIMGVVYIILGTVYIFPSLQLLRFSSGMPEGLRQGNQEMITRAFGNLKSMFRFYGILTVVIIGVYLLALVAVSIFGAFN